MAYQNFNKAISAYKQAYDEGKSGGGLSRSTADAIAAIAAQDCGTFDDGSGRVEKCFSEEYSTTIEKQIDNSAIALRNLDNPYGSEAFYEVNLKAYKEATKTTRKLSRQVNRSIKRCLNQDPRNVCMRQKTMQMMWATAPDTMKQVSDIFENGFDASTKKKALDVMEKGKIPPENAQYVTKWFETNGRVAPEAGQSTATYGSLKAEPAPSSSQRSPLAQQVVEADQGLGKWPLYGAVAIAAILILR